MMNIINRKTSLDEDALIYQVSKDTVTKEDIKKLSREQKLQYFKDYYLIKCLVIIAAIIGVSSLIYTIAINPSKEVLSVICLNESFVEDTTGLRNSLEDYIGMERKKDYVSVKHFNLEDAQMNVAFTTKIGVGSADLIICTYSDFIEFSKGGMFVDLREFLPQETYELLSEKIVTAKTVETDLEGNVLSYSDEIPFGIDISGGIVDEEYIISNEKIVLGIFIASPNAENVLKVISYITG